MSKSIKLTILGGLIAISLLMLALAALRFTGTIQMTNLSDDIVAATEVFKTDCINEHASDCFIEQSFTGEIENSILKIGTVSYNLESNDQEATITVYKNNEGIVAYDELQTLLTESQTSAVCVSGSFLHINKLSSAAPQIDYEYQEGKSYIELSRCSDELTIDNHYLLLSNFDQV